MTVLNNFIKIDDGTVRLAGRWAWLTSICGYFGIILTLAITVIGSPYGYRIAIQPCETNPCEIYGQLTEQNFVDLQKIGISADAYAIFYLVVFWLFTLAALGVSGLIFWKKPGELLPFCAAMVILSLPSIEGQIVFFGGIFQDYPWLGVLTDIISIPSGIGMVYLFLTFPNGKFKGKIFWFLFAGLGIGPAFADLYLHIFDKTYDGITSWVFIPVGLAVTVLVMVIRFIREKNFGWRNLAKYLGMLLVILVAALVGFFVNDFVMFLAILFYRSRTVLSPRERVPTKWLIYGFTFFVLMFVCFIFILPAFPALYEPGSYFFIVLNLIGFFGCGINLTGLFMAILYANAFDINLVIKRTIVYTTLTVLVVSIYIGSVVGLQALVRAITGQSSGLAVVGATLVAALLFQPLRGAIQAFVDRRFYRRKYDAARTIAALNVSLQNETDLKRLAGQVKAVVDETMQPDMVTVWLKNKARANNPVNFK